jgi:hypothetical protein
MVHPADLKRIKQVVGEIRHYYAINQNLLSGQLIITKSMVAFALYDKTEKELNNILIGLRHQGLITAIQGDRLIFPSSFLEGEC